MNGKRLLLLAAFAAVASFAAPAVIQANTLSNTVPINVKWNTQALGSLVLHTNYDPTTGLNKAGTPVVWPNLNLGHGQCSNPAGANLDGTVDFGTVAADVSVVTDCQYINAVDAIITTADPAGYEVGESYLTAPTGGYNLCIFKNGTWANNVLLPTNSVNAAGPTGQSVTNGTTCAPGTGGSGGAQTAFAVGATNTVLTHNNGAATATTEMGMDLELVIPAAGAVGAQTAVINYTLTLL